MAELLKGTSVAKAIDEETAREAEKLRLQGVSPTLAIVRVGEREDDLAYERSAMKRCEKVGVDVIQTALNESSTEAELIRALEVLNGDGTVHGILLLRPLPEHMDDAAVRAAIAAEKDVDGVTDLSLAAVFTGRGEGFAPCTARACMEMLDFYGVELTGRRAVVVGRSLVFGKPAAMMLLSKNATVTVCHTRTADLSARCREADILIVGAGRAKMLGADCFSPGQTVIDVGINVLPGGGICGDADFDAAIAIVGAISPVPGGVGTVTTSVLASNVVAAAVKRGAK